VRQRQHRGRAEGMTADGGGGGYRQRQNPGEQRLHASDVPLGRLAVCGQPVQVEAVGIELAARYRHQPVRTKGDRFVEVCFELIEKLWRETVLVVAKMQQGDRVLEAHGDGHRLDAIRSHGQVISAQTIAISTLATRT
jgi:hypothetical protein